MRCNVRRIGWFGDSKTDYIVKMSKGDRNHIGIQAGAVVKVKKGRKSELAIVSTQFKDLLSYPENIAVNKMLSQRLNIGENTPVDVIAEITEDEVNKYTSQAEFEKRQVIGALLKKGEGEKAKDTMKELGLFASEQEEEQMASEPERNQR